MDKREKEIVENAWAQNVNVQDRLDVLWSMIIKPSCYSIHEIRTAIQRFAEACVAADRAN